MGTSSAQSLKGLASHAAIGAYLRSLADGMACQLVGAA